MRVATQRTTQAQPRRASDVARDSGTVTAPRRWLQRMVRRWSCMAHDGSISGENLNASAAMIPPCPLCSAKSGHPILDHASCHQSLQNQPAGVESKPATMRRLIDIRFLDASKRLFQFFISTLCLHCTLSALIERLGGVVMGKPDAT